MQDDLSVEALKPFNNLLKETVEARKLSGGKIEKLTAMAMENIRYDSQIINDLYTQHRSLQPTSPSKIHSLYCFDSIARACRSKVNKKISANIDGERGTCAGFLLRVEGVLDGLVRSMLDTGGKNWPDGREKTKKILDIWQKGSTFSKEVIHRLQALVEAATPAPAVTSGEAAKKKNSEDLLTVSRSSTPNAGRKNDVSRSTTTPTSSPPSLTLPSQGYFSTIPTPVQISTATLPILSSGDETETSSSLTAIPAPALAPISTTSPPVGVPASLLTLLQKFTSSNPSSASVPPSDAPVTATLEAMPNPLPTAHVEPSSAIVPPQKVPNSVSIQNQQNAPAESNPSNLLGPPNMPPFPPTMPSSGYPTISPNMNVPIHSSNSFPTYPSPLPGLVNPMLHQANQNYNQGQTQMFPVQHGGFNNSFNGSLFGADQGLGGHRDYIGSNLNNSMNENRRHPGGPDGSSRGRIGGRGGYRGRGGMNIPGYNEGSRGSMRSDRGGPGYRPNMYPPSSTLSNSNISPPPPPGSHYPLSNRLAVPQASSLPSNSNSDSQSIGDMTSSSTNPPSSDNLSATPSIPKKRKSRFDQPPSHPAPPAPMPTSTPMPTPTSASIPTPIYPFTSFNPTENPNVRNQPSALASLSWSTFDPENPRSWEDLSIAFARDNHGLLPSNEVLYALGTTMMMKFGG